MHRDPYGNVVPGAGGFNASATGRGGGGSGRGSGDTTDELISQLWRTGKEAETGRGRSTRKEDGQEQTVRFRTSSDSLGAAPKAAEPDWDALAASALRNEQAQRHVYQHHPQQQQQQPPREQNSSASDAGIDDSNDNVAESPSSVAAMEEYEALLQQRAGKPHPDEPYPQQQQHQHQQQHQQQRPRASKQQQQQQQQRQPSGTRRHTSRTRGRAAADGEHSGDSPAKPTKDRAPSLPKSTPNTQVYCRSEMWRHDKEAQLESKRLKRVQEEEKMCSFQPKINKLSKATLAGQKLVEEQNVIKRLYLASAQTAQSLEAERKKKLAEETAPCTFRPTLNQSAWTQRIEPRYLNPEGPAQYKRSVSPGVSQQQQQQQQQPPSAVFDHYFSGNDTRDTHPQRDTTSPLGVSSAEDDNLNRSVSPSTRSRGTKRTHETVDDRECTFHPKIITDYPASASCAYLNTDAFERLSMPKHGRPQRSTGTASQPAQSPASHARRTPRPGGLSMDDDLFDRSGGGGAEGFGQQERNEARLQTFFARLKEQEDRRIERMELLKEADPDNAERRPQLNPKSYDILQHKSAPGFYNRLSTDLERRRSRVLREKDQSGRDEVVDAECCFKPTITPLGKIQPPRSTRELSVGDQVRREEKRKRRALERFESELNACTFAPALNRGPSTVQSKVSVRNDPTAYVEWAKTRSQQRTLHIAAEKARKAEEEQKQCTFRPAVHDAPAYIKTIAASVSLAKSPAARHVEPTKHTFGYS
ncbi:hypothetical protein DIPPA_01995 [Diplonema papillatum]|nr:hypothetical protein DIPPA_01995 [Diplonema papillatum]